jgi:hypothetical protein
MKRKHTRQQGQGIFFPMKYGFFGMFKEEGVITFNTVAGHSSPLATNFFFFLHIDSLCLAHWQQKTNGNNESTPEKAPRAVVTKLSCGFSDREV